MFVVKLKLLQRMDMMVICYPSKELKTFLLWRWGLFQVLELLQKHKNFINTYGDNILGFYFLPHFTKFTEKVYDDDDYCSPRSAGSLLSIRQFETNSISIEVAKAILLHTRDTGMISMKNDAVGIHQTEDCSSWSRFLTSCFVIL